MEFEIPLQTGMRRSEQYGMQWEFDDLKNRLVTISQSKHRTRHERMHSRVKQTLLGMKEASKDTGKGLFLGESAVLV